MGEARPRILHLVTDSRLAGAERLLLALADHFTRDRADLLFSALTDGGPFGDEVRRRGLRYVSLGYRGWLDVQRTAGRLRRILREEGITLLHTHLLHASVIGQLALRPDRCCRVVVTRHYSDYFYRFGNALSRWLDRWATGQADHVVAVSSSARDVLIRKDRVRPEQVTVIHNGVDLQHLQGADPRAGEAFRSRWGLSRRRVVGSLGALHPRKGHRYFLEALALLAAHDASLVGLVVGEGPLEGELKRHARRLRVEDRVVFTGYCPTPAAALAAMDVVVHPSLEEGFGITILEALALAKPVVASRVGGIPEIIEDGRSGLLVPAQDPRALGASVSRLLHDAPLALRLGLAGRDRVARAFTIQQVCQGYEALYDRLLRT